VMRRRALHVLGFLAAISAWHPAFAAAQQTHVLVVTGLGGEPRLSEAFHEWAVSFVDAAERRFGVPRANIVFLAERPDRDPNRITARSTREELERAFAEIARRAGPRDDIFVLLIGHGSAQPGPARVNLPGADPVAEDYARMLAPFTTQRVAFIVAASASGGFVPALSGPNRVIVTATRSELERNETVFGRYFVQAYAEDVADVDKDGRVSVLEAFEYATRETARFYESQNRLRTEHALLDDNGDGKGSQEPDPRAGDGALARAFFLGGRPAAVVADDASPELRALYEKKARLEAEIEALRQRKGSMDPERYEAELERLVLELAETNQAIRRLEGGGG